MGNRWKGAIFGLITTIVGSTISFSLFAAHETIQMGLGIVNNIFSITYEPAYTTGYFTSGNVMAYLSGTGISGSLVREITQNGTYSFTVLRGTGPYNNLLPYGPTNLRNTIRKQDTITWIDKDYPIFTGYIPPDNAYLAIFYSDITSEVTGTLNGRPYFSGMPITQKGTYEFMAVDQAGNTSTATFILYNPDPIPSGGGGGGGGGGGVVPIVKIPACEEEHLICASNTYLRKLTATCDGGLLGMYCSGAKPLPIGQTGTTQAPENILTGHFLDGTQDSATQEMVNAYMRAYYRGITTMPTLQRANMTGFLLRRDLAKMISQYTTNVVGLVPGTDKKCVFKDIPKADIELMYYSNKACQLGLMGLDSDGKTPKKTFEPDAFVNRAQFGTVLSRLLYGDTYNIKEGEISLLDTITSSVKTVATKVFDQKRDTSTKTYFSKHLEALNKAGIMKQINDPYMIEVRGYVMIMMMRTEQQGLIQARMASVKK